MIPGRPQAVGKNSGEVWKKPQPRLTENMKRSSMKPLLTPTCGTYSTALRFFHLHHAIQLTAKIGRCHLPLEHLLN